MLINFTSWEDDIEDTREALDDIIEDEFTPYQVEVFLEVLYEEIDLWKWN